MAWRYLTITSALVLLALTAEYGSAATIDVGDHTLLPNTPGQTISIMVSGGDEVAGFNLFAQSDWPAGCFFTNNSSKVVITLRVMTRVTSGKRAHI